MAERRIVMLEMNYQEVKAIVHKCRKNTTFIYGKRRLGSRGNDLPTYELLENHPDFKE